MNKIIAQIGARVGIGSLTKTWLKILVISLAVLIGIRLTQPTPAIAQPTQLTISAAISLKEALQELTPLYQQRQPQITLRYNFGSSGALQQQINNGAPVDVFIAAAAQQMDALANSDRIVRDTRRDLVANRLALIEPATRSDRLQNLRDLLGRNITRIAIGDPRSVPVGQYAAQALRKLNLWDSLQSKLVLGNNVRQVLQFVESGNAQAGIVYATDAKTSTKVKVVQIIDAKLHKPIVYPIAVIQKSTNQPSAKSYLEFLSSEPAKTIFEKYGFSTL